MVPDHTRGAHPTASGRRQTVVLFRQSYPALTNGGVVDAVLRNLEETLVQLGVSTSTTSFSAEGALDGEELLPIELLECGTTPAGALDGEELLAIELQCETTPAGVLDRR